MSETGFIVIYVGRKATDHRAIPYNIGDKLIVNEVVISGTTDITYYEVTDGKTSCGWYDSRLFKRIDDMREERLEEIGI